MVVSYFNWYSYEFFVKVPVMTRKQYTREQLDRMSHTERKNVFDHIANNHKISLKRAKIRKNRKNK